MLPVIKPYQAKSTYAGEPIEAYSKLIDSIGSTFDKTKQAANSLDIAFDQFKFLDGDAAIAKPILNKYKEAISNLAKDAAGNTRYDKAFNQVENLMLDFAKNTNLHHLGKNWAAAEEDRKKLADGDFATKYIGVDNTKTFKSFNPDGSLNNYKSGIETRLNHEGKAKEIIARVAPEILNTVEGLNEQEKQLIGSQGLYKFVTTEKKDSDTYKKVWNHIQNVAKNTPELDQYLRFKGQDALDSLLMNEGFLTQYKNEKVDIKQSPTVATDVTAAKAHAAEEDYLGSFKIEPTGAVIPGVNNTELLPEDAKAYNKKGITRYISNAPAAMGGLGRSSGVTELNHFNDKASKEIARYKALNPKFRNLPDEQVAKIVNWNRTQFNDEMNTKFGHTDLIIRTPPMVEGSRFEMDGRNIKAQDTNVVLVNGDRKDKATLKEKFKKVNPEFDFDKPITSQLLGINMSMDGNANINGGLTYLLEDSKGNKQEVIKYNDAFNKQLKPVNEVFTTLHKLVKQSTKEHLEKGVTKTTYSTLSTTDGDFKVRPLVGNLGTYRYGKDITIPNVGEGVDTRIEIIDKHGDVHYLTAYEFQMFVGQALVKDTSVRTNFKKPNID